MKNSKLKKVLIFLGAFVIVLIVISSLTNVAAEQQLDRIENQVAQDAEEQYNIAKRNGNKMDAYVHAGMVAAAYLQAKDEPNYKKWKEIENQEAKAVEMPVSE